ncbi:MAG: hypothetical protein COA91_06930 [Robiginitomaculum sp.]|nr:MAG: hypothetical protein COA91_06930 [Robiginitomaculum sp.]
MLKQLEPQIKTQGITKAVIATITTVLTFATAESSWAQTTCTVNSTNIVVPSNSTSNQGSVTANSGQIINITVTNNGSASGALFINIQPNLLFSDAISPGSTLSTSVATSRDEMGDLVFRNEGPTELVFSVVCQTISSPPPTQPPPSSPPGSQPPSGIVPRNADTSGFMVEPFALGSQMSFFDDGFFDDVDGLNIGTRKNTSDCPPLESRLEELERRRKKMSQDIEETRKSILELLDLQEKISKEFQNSEDSSATIKAYKLHNKINTLHDRRDALDGVIKREKERLKKAKCPVSASGFTGTTTGVIVPPVKVKPKPTNCPDLKSKFAELERRGRKLDEELKVAKEAVDNLWRTVNIIPEESRDYGRTRKREKQLKKRISAIYKKFRVIEKEEERLEKTCSAKTKSSNNFTPNTNKNSIPKYTRYKTIKVVQAGQSSDYGGGAFALLANSAKLNSLTNATISTGGTEKNPWHFFLKGKFNGLNDNRVGTDRNSNIFTIDAGAMRRINPETIIGGQVTLKDGTVKSNALRAQLDATFYGASVFVRRKLDNKTYLSGTAGYSKGDNQLNLDGATGTFNTNVLTGTVRLQTNIKKGPFTLTPDAQFTVTEFRNSGYVLSNNQTALEKRLTYTDVSVGGKLAHAAPTNGLGTKLRQGVRSNLGFRLVHAGRSGGLLQLTNGAFAEEIGFGVRVNGGINVPMDNNMQLHFGGNFALFNDVQTYSLIGRISKKF